MKAFASEEYSPIRHLASIIWPPWLDRDKGILLMLTFAFDAGGDDGTECMTVAGFASSMKYWDEFSREWKSRLDKDGIAFFRAVDANSFRGPFEHWRDLPNKVELRQHLFADLMELIERNTFRKFSCTIVNQEYRNTNNEARQQFAESAYSVAARTCEKEARHWALTDEWNRCPEMEIAAIFEAGDAGQGKLQERLLKRLWTVAAQFSAKERYQARGWSYGTGIHSVTGSRLVGAWELNRATRDFYEKGAQSESEFRWPLQQFLKRRPLGRFGIYTPQNFKYMDDMIALEAKIIEWEKRLALPKRNAPHDTLRL